LTRKSFFAMLAKNMKSPVRPPALSLTELGALPPAYLQLQNQLGHIGWICQGTVVARPLIRRVTGRTVKKGPYYLWTCKVKGRTVCRSLSQAQYRLVAQAIQKQRRLQQILQRMQAFTLKTILKNVPGVKKRK
jgi:hypothetical protein